MPGPDDPTPGATVTPRSTPVEAPGGGTINEEVKPKKAGPTEKADLDEGVTAPDYEIKLTSVKRASVKATTPGEVSGKAIVVKVTVTSRSTEPISLNSVIIGLTDADGNLGQPTTAEPFRAFSGSLEPTKEATATYVFMSEQLRGASVQISITPVSGDPTALFRGKI